MMYLATAAALIVYLVGVWLLSVLLHLHSQDLWVFRGALAVVGFLAAGVFLWFYRKKVKERAAANGGLQSEGGTDGKLAAILREAEARLRSSKLGRGAALNRLPCVFLLGDSGTAKTSILEHSGLEAELLGGQVYENNEIVPTPSANIWFAQNLALIEINSKTAGTRALSQLLRRLRPGGVRILTGVTPPRAAVVCFSCEAFLQAGASDAVSAAVRRVRACLEDIARSSGISFPVYVLFTKADRIPSFAEFSGNLSNEEDTQVLGATLPLRSVENGGVYAEQEAQRLNTAFNNLILSLADKRSDLLAREFDSQKLAGIYEFPRELRKLRSAAVQLLVDLCRPSQLRATPFLRGFYFSGVRAVVINEVRPAAESQSVPATQFNGSLDATRMFNAGQSLRQDAIPQAKVVSSRKVPRWTFLTRFFSEVLLKDPLAMAGTAASVNTSSLRRVLSIVGVALCLLLSLAFIISYSGNHALAGEIAAASHDFSATPATISGTPTVATLMQLDALRQSVEKLSLYRREGPPLSLRWGLYAGDELYQSARTIYFSRFNQLLFASTQATLLGSLKQLPSAPSPSGDYGGAYEALKAYLITTSNHDKSSREFLAPVLLKHWNNGKNPDAQSLVLVQKQFEFYAEELKIANPYSSENDTLVVERARHYLAQFAGTQRVYQFMLAEAGRKSPSVAFNKQFAGSAEVLVDTKEVSGSYTKQGWLFMQDAIKNADRFFSGEQWVLGQNGGQSLDGSKLEQELTDLYTADFINQWQQFLRAAAVVRYGSVKDASTKLTKLSSNQSPLLAMMCVVSQNTAVESTQIKAAFQPVQFVVPANCAEKYLSESNTGYMNALVALNALIEQMANTPGAAESLTPQVMTSALQAKVVTRQVAQSFRIDPANHLEATVQKLMEDPITNTESLVRNAGPAELNGKGRALCSQFAELTAKYPFNPNGTREATLQEVNAMFQPQQGALWTFYEGTLRATLVRQGGQFVAKPGSPAALNPAFVNFLNNAAAFTDAAYPDNSQQPRIVYSIRPERIEGIENVGLAINGQTITSGAAAQHELVWSGSPNSEVRLTGGPGLSYSGLWAVFKFFGDADRWTKTAAGYLVEWNLRLGRATPLTIRFNVDMGKAAPVFQKSFLSNLRCVADIAR